MKKIKICLLAILTSSGFFLKLHTQIPAHLDEDNWVLNTTKSDEFDGIVLDNSKWDALDPTLNPPIGCNCWGGGAIFRPINVSVDGNYLNLEVEDKPSDTLYYSGGVQSVNENFSYGYFEISAKLPGFYLSEEEPCGKGFWPAFWTYHVEYSGNCRVIHDELDILEPSGKQYENANVNVAGWHDEYLPSCDTDHVKLGEVIYTHNEPLFEDYHKYAAEWLPDRIIFYFDDQPIYVEYDHPKMIMDPQFVVIDQQIMGSYSLHPSTVLPDTMSVDYFRYYELNLDSCTQNVTILNNSQLNSLSGVRNNITIGNGSSNISLSSGQTKTLRASNKITINGE